MSATAAEHTGVGQAPARQGRHNPVANPFRQPRAVWAVAFACVVSFMGIGPVDPILPSLAGQLHATPTRSDRALRDRTRDRHRHRSAGRIRAGRHQLARPVLRRHDADGGRAGRHAGAGQENPSASHETVADGAARCAAPSRLAHHGHHRALYNWGFFTVLGFAPFPMHLDTHQLGIAFTGWGVLVAVCAVFVAPRLQARFGIAPTLYVNLTLFAADIAVIALFTNNQAVLIAAVV